MENARREFRIANTQLGRFAQLLRTEYNRWSMLFYFANRRHATIEDFATYLSVSPDTLRLWLDQAVRPTESELVRLPQPIVQSARQVLTGK